MRTAVMGVAVVFTALMAFATIYVLIKNGPDLFTLLSLLVVLILVLGVFGALGGPPDRRS
jgi:hypothetical protein